MIESFRHKGLSELFEYGKTSRLPQERLKKLQMILSVLEAAHEPKDLNVPAFRLHKLKKPPLDGCYSIDVNGNYRVVFRFEEGMASEVDYLDTH